MLEVQSVPMVCSVQNTSAVRNSAPAFRANEEQDTVDFSSKKEPPKINRLRLMFGLLKDEQIKQINESGYLPKNAKFVSNNAGSYTICNNFFGLRVGTQKIPAGFEVRKNILGFATVVPVDTNGLLIKNK